jgi:hypothetical protein
MRRELVSTKGSRGNCGGSAPRLRRPCGDASRRSRGLGAGSAPPTAKSMFGQALLVGRTGAQLDLLDVQDVAPVGFVP